MPLNTLPLPFGLRKVKLTPIKTDGSLDTVNAAVLPASRTFSFTDSQAFEDLNGDDKVMASHGTGATVNWDLEAGGISLEAWKVLSGGTITSTGVTPSQVKTYSKLVSDDRPYFQAEGQAISDSGGDLHCVVYRCKATGDLSGSFANGAFTLTAASGKGYGDTMSAVPTNKLYDFVQNETVTAIP